MSKNLVLAVLVALTLTAPAHALLSPTGIIYSELRASFGADPCVTVAYPSDDTFTLKVCDAAQAQALATVLSPSFDHIGHYALKVVDPSGKEQTPQTVEKVVDLKPILETAFKKNPYFAKAYPYAPMNPDDVQYVLTEFKPLVIAVPIDDIGTPYKSKAYVAADLFTTYLNASAGGRDYGLRTTTGPMAK